MFSYLPHFATNPPFHTQGEAVPGCIGIDDDGGDYCVFPEHFREKNETQTEVAPWQDGFQIKLYWEEGYLWQNGERAKKEWLFNIMHLFFSSNFNIFFLFFT